MKLLTKNIKSEKSEKMGYLSYYMQLAPSNEARLAGYNTPNVCPNASKGCRNSCIFKAGFGQFNNVQEARIKRLAYLMENKRIHEKPDQEKLIQLEREIHNACKLAYKNKMKLAIRLNAFSDLPVETWGIMEKFPSVQFYDYTKNLKRMQAFIGLHMPRNYHLTFSYSENNKAKCQYVLEKGQNVAVPFKKVPKKYLGRPVIDGDKHDLTFLHKNKIIGLAVKGPGKHDKTGFIVKDGK